MRRKLTTSCDAACRGNFVARRGRNNVQSHQCTILSMLQKPYLAGLSAWEAQSQNL